MEGFSLGQRLKLSNGGGPVREGVVVGLFVALTNGELASLQQVRGGQHLLWGAKGEHLILNPCQTVRVWPAIPSPAADPLLNGHW